MQQEEIDPGQPTATSLLGGGDLFIIMIRGDLRC